jgi:hypothetical protein
MLGLPRSDGAMKRRRHGAGEASIELAFFNDVDHVELHRLISRAFVVNGAVRNCETRSRAALVLARRSASVVFLQDVLNL